MFALHPFFYGIHYRQCLGLTLGGYFLIRGAFRLRVCLEIIEQIQPFYRPRGQFGMWCLGVGEFTAHVSHATQKGHIAQQLKIIIYTVSVGLYSTTVIAQLCTRDSPRTRAVHIKEIETVALRAVVEKLPRISFPALAWRVGYAQRDLVYL